jgi:hypothetical protein
MRLRITPLREVLIPVSLGSAVKAAPPAHREAADGLDGEDDR